VPSDAIYLRASELLTYAAGLLTGIDRQYVALATPALDCPDQLTVHVTGLARQAAGSAPLPDYAHGLATQEATVNVAAYAITVVRCIPRSTVIGSPPLPSDYEAASEQLLTDLWLLWKGIPAGIRDRLLWAGCEQITLGAATPIIESGGLAAWVLPVSGEVYASG
jgi:hypothetical protein